MRTKIAKLVSGGEAGAEAAALSFAQAQAIPYGGYCPKNYEGPGPAPCSQFPELTPFPCVDLESCTRLNVDYSDATLVILPSLELCPKVLAVEEAALALGRPYLVTEGTDVREVADWVSTLVGPLALHIAGSPQSDAREAHSLTSSLLQGLLEISYSAPVS